MADEETLSLESYILSSDKHAALKSFPPASTFKTFLNLNNLLRDNQFDTPEFASDLEDLRKKDSSLYQKIQLRKTLKELETTEDEAKRNKIISELNNEHFKYRFDYNAPQSSEIKQEYEYSSKLSDNLFPNSLEEAHKNTKTFGLLTPSGKLKLDASKMTNEIFKFFLDMKEIHSISGVPQKIAELLKSNNFHEPECFKYLSIEQLSEILNLHEPVRQKPEFIKTLIYKKYLYLLGNDDVENYEIYKKVWFEIADYPENLNSLKSTVLLNLLTLGRNFGIYDEKLFQEYLKAPRPSHIFLIIIKDFDQKLRNFSEFLRGDCPNDQNLVEEYLFEILKNKENTSEYDRFFEEKFLRRTFARIKVKNGASPSQFEDVFSHKQIEDAAAEIELEPCRENPPYFQRDQLIQFSVKVKNIQKLLVKVLELNTKAYYLKNNSQITTDINLDGLVAKYERTYEYNESPLVMVKRTLEFPELVDKAGLFVIELIGNGRHCRVIIKKGSLKYVSKLTAAGHLILILNENNQICKGPGSGVTIDGRFYSTENEKGVAFLPFANQAATKNLILTDGVITDLVEGFSHAVENYELKTAFLVHEEQLLMGNRATISIKPRLYVNGTKALDYLIKECKAAITTTDVEGITASRIYPNLSVPAKNSLINLDIEIPPRLRNMSISFSGEIESVTKKGEKIPLNSSYSISVNENLGNTVIYGAYLKYGNQGYQVELRGRGGEPLPRQQIQVTLYHEDWKKENKETLMTDENGNIYLGSLKNILSVRISTNVHQQAQNFEWAPATFKSRIQYPSLLNLCEGDEFGIPVDFEAPEINFREVNLLSTKSGNFIDNYSKKLAYDPETSMLWLKDLEKGAYSLKINSQNITIFVRDGMHWGDNQFILSENVVVPTSGQYRSLSIKSAETEENKLKISLAGDYDNAVIHALYFNYLNNKVLEEFSQLYSLYVEPDQTEFNFSKQKSHYLPSRKLDEEYQYTLERKYLAKHPGNTLAKPQLLLKRLFLNDTTTETQHAKAGETMQRREMDKAYRGRVGAAIRNYSQDLLGASLSAAGQGQMLDFLETPAKWIYNLEAEEGKAEISVEDLNYSHVLILATNGEGLSSKVVNFEGSNIKIRQLGLAKSLDQEIAYSEQMKSKGIFGGENFTIGDISSTSYEIIDSVDKLYRLQKELIKTNGSRVAYDPWDFLGKWQTLPYTNKLELYDKYMCHELNLFIYKKDPTFFSEVIQPFLSSKMEKDIVDLYLLSQPLDEYISLNKFLKLNTLEKILLIERTSETNPEFSREAAKTLKDETDAIARNYQLRNRRIETVLRFNLISGDPRGPPPPPPPPMASMAGMAMPGMMAPNLAMFGAMNECAQMDIMECKSMARSAQPRMMMKKKMERRGSPRAMEESEDPFSPPLGSDEDEDMIEDARNAMPAYYQKMDSTKEFAETFYYDIKNPTQNSGLVPNKRFWSELAVSVSNNRSLILSEDILETTDTLTELICSLAFSDLPFTAEKHAYSLEGRSITYTAGSNFLVFYKELAETSSEINTQVLVAQRYFDPNDRYIQDQEGTKDKTITQFIKQKIYACQVVITNTAGSQINVSALTEVPQGSIPVTPPKYTSNQIRTLPNFHTQTFEYQFYFPNSGTFTHYPANITYNEKVIAKADSKHLEVNDVIRVDKFETFKDLVLSGRKDLVLEFLTNENLFSKAKEFSVTDFCWMLKDKRFWDEVMKILKSRNYYFEQVWSFGIFHKNLEILKDIIATKPDFVNKIGKFFKSGIITTGKGDHRHLEFDPLVNARAHRLGNQPRITNNRFKQVYKEFLQYLAEKENIEAEDQLGLVQYYILQDRYQEATDIFRAIPLQASQEKPGASYLQIQYDYLSCYLDINLAGSISVLYENYPVNTWKKLFNEVTKLVREISAQEVLTKAEAKENEPSLMFTVEAGEIKLNYQFVKHCKVRLYKIDLEVLFSKNPFLIENTQDFGFVKPNTEIEVDLPENGEGIVKIPEEFEGQNIVIEVDYGTYTVSKSHFATSLKTNLIERYGVIKVMNSNLMPRPAAYVKAFVKRNNGNVEFYKDGYTDVRGKFDYVSLNTDTLNTIQKFALLVVDDEFGSLVHEASPPPQ